jgi:hypothetical protein
VKITVQVVIETNDESPAMVADVFSLERASLAPDTLGLRLDEAKDLLSAVQEAMVDEQVNAALAERAACPHCNTPHRHKDTRAIVVRSLLLAAGLADRRSACLHAHGSAGLGGDGLTGQRRSPSCRCRDRRFRVGRVGDRRLTSGRGGRAVRRGRR